MTLYKLRGTNMTVNPQRQTTALQKILGAVFVISAGVLNTSARRFMLVQHPCGSTFCRIIYVFGSEFTLFFAPKSKQDKGMISNFVCHSYTILGRADYMRNYKPK